MFLVFFLLCFIKSKLSRQMEIEHWSKSINVSLLLAFSEHKIYIHTYNTDTLIFLSILAAFFSVSNSTLMYWIKNINLQWWQQDSPRMSFYTCFVVVWFLLFLIFIYISSYNFSLLLFKRHDMYNMTTTNCCYCHCGGSNCSYNHSYNLHKRNVFLKTCKKHWLWKLFCD